MAERRSPIVVRSAHGRNLSRLRERLASDPAVRYVEPDYLLERSRTPDDPFYVRQYALQPGGGGVSAPQAWDQRTNCSLVAVLDSGVQYDHPDLKSSNVWHNPDEKKATARTTTRTATSMTTTAPTSVTPRAPAAIRKATAAMSRASSAPAATTRRASLVPAGPRRSCRWRSWTRAAAVRPRSPGRQHLLHLSRVELQSPQRTSMAAPLVAAAAAMLRARDSKLSYSDLRSLLKESVDPLPALKGKVVTGGRLNIARALDRAGS